MYYSVHESPPPSPTFCVRDDHANQGIGLCLIVDCIVALHQYY